MKVYLVVGIVWIALILIISIWLGKYLDEREQVYMGKTKSKVKKKKRRLMAAAIANGTESKKHGQKKEK